jgi:hypothetical protein
VSVAALVLGIVGTVLAVCSLTWNVALFFLSGSRAKITPIVGVLAEGGLYAEPATTDPTDAVLSAAKKAPGQYVIGVEVANRGRMPLHITGWALRAEPSEVSAVVVAGQLTGSMPPCDIAPGVTETFVTELQEARDLTEGVQAIDPRPQRVRAAVTSGGRVYRSKPIHPAALMIGS